MRKRTRVLLAICALLLFGTGCGTRPESAAVQNGETSGAVESESRQDVEVNPAQEQESGSGVSGQTERADAEVKKMELAIMKVMPFGILLYINMGNRGYFDSLYHNLTGAVIMTGCLGIYLGAYLLGEHIMKGIVSQMV